MWGGLGSNFSNIVSSVQKLGAELESQMDAAVGVNQDTSSGATITSSDAPSETQIDGEPEINQNSTPPAAPVVPSRESASCEAVQKVDVVSPVVEAPAVSKPQDGVKRADVGSPVGGSPAVCKPKKKRTVSGTKGKKKEDVAIETSSSVASPSFKQSSPEPVVEASDHSKERNDNRLPDTSVKPIHLHPIQKLSDKEDEKPPSSEANVEEIAHPVSPSGQQPPVVKEINGAPIVEEGEHSANHSADVTVEPKSHNYEMSRSDKPKRKEPVSETKMTEQVSISTEVPTGPSLKELDQKKVVKSLDNENQISDYEAQLKKCSNIIKDLETKLMLSDKELATANMSVGSMRQILTDKENECSQLSESLQARERSLESAMTQIAEINAQLSSKTSQLEASLIENESLSGKLKVYAASSGAEAELRRQLSIAIEDGKEKDIRLQSYDQEGQALAKKQVIVLQKR